MRYRLSLLLICCLFCLSCAHKTWATSLDIAIASLHPRAQLFNQPQRDAKALGSVDTPVLINGFLNNAAGTWYRVAYPRKGWVLAANVRFEAGSFKPDALPLEQRLLLGFLATTGITDKEWQDRLGKPWLEDTVISPHFGQVHIAIWPGVALAWAKDDRFPFGVNIISAVSCSRAQAAFGSLLPGISGALLKELDPSFEPKPYAQLAYKDFIFLLDIEGKVASLAYGKNKLFLACPILDSPDPDLPFQASFFYPEQWCPTQELDANLFMEGEFLNSHEGSVSIRLDSGLTRDFYIQDQASIENISPRPNMRVRAAYNKLQFWDKEIELCRHIYILKNLTPALYKSWTADVCPRIVFASGEAQGILTRLGHDDNHWEIMLDSDRPFPFRSQGNFDAKQELKEGMRIAITYESFLEWQEARKLCLPQTLVAKPARILSF